MFEVMSDVVHYTGTNEPIVIGPDIKDYTACDGYGHVVVGYNEQLGHIQVTSNGIQNYYAFDVKGSLMEEKLNNADCADYNLTGQERGCDKNYHNLGSEYHLVMGHNSDVNTFNEAEFNSLLDSLTFVPKENVALNKDPQHIEEIVYSGNNGRSGSVKVIGL